MLSITDEQLQNMNLNEIGDFLKSGNSILTGATLTNGSFAGQHPDQMGSAACDILQWIKENTPYTCRIGTYFEACHSSLEIKFYKQEDLSLVLSWDSGPIRGRVNNSKMSTIHEIMGVMLLKKICKHLYDNFGGA